MNIVCFCLISALAILAKADVTEVSERREPKLLRSPRPLRDRFRNVQRSLTKSGMNAEIDIFKSYGCEHMVVVSNEAESPYLLWCSSGDEDVKEIHVLPGESFAFTFKPKRNGKSVFQCVLNHETKWATFAVYNEEELHSPPREDSYVYRYSVRKDGVYVNEKHKIRSFFRSFDHSTVDYIYGDYPEQRDISATVDLTVQRDPQQFITVSLKNNVVHAPKALWNHFNAIRANLSERNLLYQAPQTIVDRFNIIRANISKDDLRTEIDDFANYDCEHMVVLSNDATDSFRLWCSSGDESIEGETVSKDRAFSFSLKPKHNGNSRFQCLVNYRTKWANFDVFNGKENGCTCKHENSYVHHFSIRHQGVYGEGNTKIKSLFNGRNQYTLWESYNDYSEMPYGKLMTGYVDGPSSCTTVPWEVNDRSAAITVCDGQCVIAYEHFNCEGRRQLVQAYSGCRHVKLESGLYKGLSSVKGCL